MSLDVIYVPDEIQRCCSASEYLNIICYIPEYRLLIRKLFFCSIYGKQQPSFLFNEREVQRVELKIK